MIKEKQKYQRIIGKYQKEVIRIRKSKKNRQHNGQNIPKG